jgi:hypothetical protein
VYEPYCANYLKASETTVELVQLLEASNLRGWPRLAMFMPDFFFRSRIISSTRGPSFLPSSSSPCSAFANILS